MLATFGVGQVIWSILWFFLFLMWLMLLFHVTIDIFRSRDLSGAGKALWILFVILLPYLGVLAYLLIRGGKMYQHDLADAQANQAAVDDYIRTAAGSTRSPAQELEHLADLHQRGVIDDDEFARLKSNVIPS